MKPVHLQDISPHILIVAQKAVLIHWRSSINQRLMETLIPAKRSMITQLKEWSLLWTTVERKMELLKLFSKKITFVTENTSCKKWFVGEMEKQMNDSMSKCF